MTKLEKIKKMVLIALGFAFSTYFIMSGMAMLDEDSKVQNNQTKESTH